MRQRRHRHVLGWAALVGMVSSVGLAACSPTADPPRPVGTPASSAPAGTASGASSPAASGASAPSSAAAPSSSSAPSTQTAPTYAEKPAKTAGAGTVSDASTATASGKGDTAVGYTVKGELAAVVTVDCSSCTAPVTVTGPNRASAFGKVPKGGSGAYLMTPLKSASSEQQVWVQSKGPWKVTISSWNTVPRKQGTVHAKGSHVFWIDGKHSEALFEWKRSHPGDKVQVRYFQAGKDHPLLFGTDDATFSDSEKITTPGVLSVQTEGEWTFTPGS